MYSYIKGLIVDIQSDHIVLENNGIGYLIYVSNPYAFSKGKDPSLAAFYKREAKQSLYAGKFLIGVLDRSIRRNRY